MSKQIKVGDVFYRVIIGKNTVSMYESDGEIVINKQFTASRVEKVYVNAISRLEVDESSKKYFFTVKERYFYSTEKGGVTQDFNYFELNDVDGVVGRCRDGSSIFKTKPEANDKADKWDESLKESYEEKANEIRNQLVLAERKLT